MLLSVIDLIAFLCLAVQFVIAGYFLYLVYWSIELPPADGTVPALPDELPRVLVQIPVYNEPLVIDRVLGAAAALDWPRDRLVVQLLDDSTDITSDIAVHAVARLRRDGVDVAHIRRDDRSGFKAGALAEGLKLCDAPYVAVFDADFVPEPGWLRGAMAALLAEPRAAFVQTRIEWGNGEKNWLTRAQRLMQDAHFAVEQDIRARRGVPFQFNGTGGIWRRAAVEEAGGWSHDTLSEDLDLVLRTSLKGWHGVFLMEPHVVGELPAKLDDFSAQQSRWSKGFMQVARKLLGPIWRSEWSDEAKFMTTVALGQQLIFPVLAVGIVALVAVGDRPWLFAGLLPLPAVAVVHRHAGGAVRHDLRRLAPAEARRPGALPRHGGQRAGADRLSCRRQRRPDRRRRVRAQDRVQPHAQGGDVMAIVATLALLLAAIFAVCCVLLAAFVGSLLYMVILHHRLKERGLRREEELLATPLPHDAELPHVVVQIPSFNEGGVLRRGIEAAAALDWPRDKLHIQVLDDSTDETAELARTVVAELKAQGLRHRGPAAHRPLGLQGRRPA